MKTVCGVCGGTKFSFREILWEGLVSEWQISPQEIDYINCQQGMTCTNCGANIRSIALSNAIRSFLGTSKYLRELASEKHDRECTILEINEAGSLSPFLKTIGTHTLGSYPEVDMHSLPYPDNSFDLIVHSDTLEHVKNPIHALRECKRVTRVNGAIAFTVPIIIGRLSRSRAGLPQSYHGNATTADEDYVVQTEYGADVWTQVMEAGFTEVSIHTVEYPSGIALLAKNSCL